MAYYKKINFDREAFSRSISESIDNCLSEAIDNGFTYQEIDGKKRYNLNLYGAEYEISFAELKAWIIEYGQGQAAEVDRNPYWKDYVENSGYTSSKRKDGTVVRRGPGEYKSIYFKHNKIKHYEHGTEPEGEALSDGMQKMLAIKADPFIDKSFDSTWKYFVSILDRAIKEVESKASTYVTVEKVEI